MNADEALIKVLHIAGFAEHVDEGEVAKAVRPYLEGQLRPILRQLEIDSFKAGYELAQATVGEWYKPEH